MNPHNPHRLKLSAKKKFSLYFDSYWNFFDCFFILAYFAYFIVGLFSFTNDKAWMRWLQSAVLTMTFIKMTYYVRIFKRMGKMVNLLAKAIVDLKYYLFFYALLICFFAVLITIIVESKLQYDSLKYTQANDF